MDKLELGLIVGLTEDLEASFRKLADLGLATCQINCWEPQTLDDTVVARVRDAQRATGVRVSSHWAGHTGATVWNFLEGPATIGLAPAATRAQRLEELKMGADFAAKIGVPSITTHVGFIPEDPRDPQYGPLVEALRSLATHCASLGLMFCFETGQETPVTLLRTIEDIGTDNLGINLDPANLILYGKANPVDALDVFGTYVRGLHAKDGFYPTNGRELGRETPLGEGKVDFPVLMHRLKELGYDAPVTIEREITGPQQEADIRLAIERLEPML